MTCFYLEQEISEWLIKDMKMHKHEIGYIEQDPVSPKQTIYEYFTENRDEKYSNPSRTWYTYAYNNYCNLEKTSNELAENYIHILLDYGKYVGDFWYKKWSMEKMSIDDLKRFDATSNFETDIWSHIKTITVVQNDNAEVVTVNPNATDDIFTIVFSKPADESLDVRWDAKWEEGEEPINPKADDKEKKTAADKNASIRARNEKFRNHITQMVCAIQENSQKNVETDNNIPLAVLKEYLELYVKYEHQKVITWYEKGIEKDSKFEGKYQWLTTDDNPKNYFPKPFIAQTVISCSYGSSQIMLSTAWEYGYRYHPVANPNKSDYKYGLYHYQTSILLGIQILVSKTKKATYSNWVEVWNTGLYDYNRSRFYPIDLREGEKNFVPKVQNI